LPVQAQVTRVDGNKVQKLRTAAEAQALADRFAKASLQVCNQQIYPDILYAH
jgi:hypothetical protein